MRYVSDKVLEKIKTHFMISDYFLENRAVCEIMWKYMIQPERPKMTVGCMRFACWTTKATDPNILLFHGTM
jgi:hypothetical protein